MRRYILLSLAVTAISGFASNAYAANPKVGLSFSDFATERWARERDEMSKLLKDAGYEVLV
ncbi:MAG: D-xylose transporter subunit XylF, partial [Deltaproteobacteria bacterium]